MVLLNINLLPACFRGKIKILLLRNCVQFSICSKTAEDISFIDLIKQQMNSELSQTTGKRQGNSYCSPSPPCHGTELTD